MHLRFTRLPASTRGIYTIGGELGCMFPSSLYLHPDAAASFLELEEATGGLVYSGIRRTAEQSLLAVRSKAGTLAPAYSAHGFGLAFDVAVDATLARVELTYGELLLALGQFGWYCHRRDGKQSFEAWHFNFLGPDASRYLSFSTSNWSMAVERRIQDLYGTEMRLDDFSVQRALAKLGLYHGAIDGIIGPRSREALYIFQRAWRLPKHGEADARTQRTLAFVAAETT